MTLLSFTLTFTGLIALSLSMKRHFLQSQPRHIKPPSQLLFLFRIMGCLLLVFSVSLSMAQQGLAFGLVFWTGLVTLAALLQALLLTYRPSWVVPFGLISLVLGTASGLTS
jgi:hypothetical protein